VHQPYESFRGSFEVFATAAVRDPSVIAMKTAVYRTGDDSVLVGSLIQCAEEGKQSVCLVELKARFDERRNIEWSRALEQAGVHVVYGFPDLKIHAKMTLVVRREGDGLRRYAHIGTGNYHAATARLYEDVGIFTADEEITADVADLFNYITGFGRPRRFRKLLVAPFTLRSGLTEQIRAVAAAAANGENARIRLKVNNLVDPKIVQELCAASQAGARVDIMARSACSLRPGVEGLSENIRVKSIVGRFLEHSRLYAFDAGDTSTMYLGSADLMQRNLDHRIEVLAPIESARVRQDVKAILDSAFADDTNTWELTPDGIWSRVEPAKPSKPHSHQDAMLRRATARARRRARARRGAEA
jgi:polyphosphate kinase